MTSGPITSLQIGGETMETVTDFILGGLQNHCRWLTVAMKLKDACSLEKSSDQPTQHIEKQRHHFANKGPCSQSCFFPVVMYGCESWTIKRAEC